VYSFSHYEHELNHKEPLSQLAIAVHVGTIRFKSPLAVAVLPGLNPGLQATHLTETNL